MAGSSLSSPHLFLANYVERKHVKTVCNIADCLHYRQRVPSGPITTGCGIARPATAGRSQQKQPHKKLLPCKKEQAAPPKRNRPQKDLLELVFLWAAKRRDVNAFLRDHA